jgi:hypothetical protein
MLIWGEAALRGFFFFFFWSRWLSLFEVDGVEWRRHGGSAEFVWVVAVVGI